MAHPLSVAGFNQIQLQEIFKDPTTLSYTKAASALIKYAPETIKINGVMCRHWVSFFNPDTLSFAFYCPSTKKFHYRTAHHLRKERQPHHS